MPTTSKRSPHQPPGHPLDRYRRKRDFSRTREPEGRDDVRAGAELSFVVQKHAASRLHYDFRLEMNGVLVSWALPKGPSFDPADKPIAVHVEDHPLSYGSFEGVIPPKQYGAGRVIVWDRGHWTPIGDPDAGMAAGKLVFELHGQKLLGRWELVRIAKPGDKQELWILFKKRDALARLKADYDVLRALPDSVIARPLAAVGSAGRTAGAAPSAAGTPDAPDALAAASAAPMPVRVAPQLATLATGVPPHGRWLYEIKLDGYRLMARLEGGAVALVTRGGHDWTKKMPTLAATLAALPLRSAWLDGEIVVLGDGGVPSFNALQNALDRAGAEAAIQYFVFDLPYLDGHDLRRVALQERRALLRSVLERGSGDAVRLSDDFAGEPGALLQSACAMGLEGLIAKRADAPYTSGRSDTWLKLKCKLRQEFVIAGYTDRSDGSAQIGSLLLGVSADNGQLESVGSVGTGWSSAEAAELKKKLARLEVATSPFKAAPKRGRWTRRAAGAERWVKPRLVAEVGFAEMTPDGQIRHASYIGLRLDKPATEVQRETVQAGAPLQRLGSATAANVRVSHGERVIDASTGLTKLDLVRYYESVAEMMLPHLVGRPCSLVRGPNGVGGTLFFQKHREKTPIPGVTDLDPALWPDHAALLEVGSTQALLSAAQMNTIEFHTWNATARRIAAPDRMIFDLDPGEGTSWPHVREAAVLVRSFLHELGLQAWLKTSGGKGLHVVVPLTPRWEFDAVKAFSEAVVQHLAQVIPARFVAKSGPANRIGKLFVDYLRNGHGATTAAAFSARARPGLGVSMPIAWEELDEVEGGDHWTIATAREHLSFRTSDPWEAYWTTRQTLTAAAKVLGFDSPRPRRKRSPAGGSSAA